MINVDVKLENENYIALLSSKLGATCFRLYSKVYDTEILRTPKDEEDRKTNIYLFGNPILFPPNRIRGGKFTFEGRQYSLPINEAQTNCHIHGNLHSLPFVVEYSDNTSVTFKYTAKSNEYVNFPHSFTIYRKFSLDENGLSEETEVVNNSTQNMPFALAYHTSFNLPNIIENFDDFTFFAPVEREQLRDGNYLPTGEFGKNREQDKLLNNGEFKPLKQTISAFYERMGDTVKLLNKKTNVEIYYTAYEGFKYWMIWKGKEPCMVVEPQTCLIDCFNLKTPAIENGLIVIKPNEKRSFKTVIGIRKI